MVRVLALPGLGTAKVIQQPGATPSADPHSPCYRAQELVQELEA
jgi:hypothetical protein